MWEMAVRWTVSYVCMCNKQKCELSYLFVCISVLCVRDLSIILLSMCECGCDLCVFCGCMICTCTWAVHIIYVSYLSVALTFMTSVINTPSCHAVIAAKCMLHQSFKATLSMLLDLSAINCIAFSVSNTWYVSVNACCYHFFKKYRKLNVIPPQDMDFNPD